MKIEINLQGNKKMYLESDSANFILHDGERISEKTGDVTKINAKFYGTLKTAVDGIYTHGLLKSEATDLRLLRQDIDNISEQIKELY